MSGDQLHVEHRRLLEMDAHTNQVAVSQLKAKKTNYDTANSLCNFQVYLEMVWLDAPYKIRVTPVTENQCMDTCAVNEIVKCINPIQGL